jgi:hypothetical protein
VLGLRMSLAVEFSVLAPRLLGAHIRRKLRHRRAVDVVDSDSSGSSEEMSASEPRTCSTGSGLNDATAPWLLLSTPQTGADQGSGGPRGSRRLVAERGRFSSTRGVPPAITGTFRQD